jgi:polysaccharide export outer membrane protein
MSPAESVDTKASFAGSAVPPIGLRRSSLTGTERANLVLLICAALSVLHPSGSEAQADSSHPAGAPANGIGVQPGDLIRLKVWREPDMSGDVVIDAAGEAIFPRIGRIVVTGWAPDSLRRFLVASFSRYLKNPAIDITVLPRVTILGAVRTPGVQNLDPTFTIADAVALAGGATPDGQQDNIELRRRGAKMPVKLSLGERLSDTPVQSGDQLIVPERSWLSRNPGLMLGVISAATSIMYFIFR